MTTRSSGTGGARSWTAEAAEASTRLARLLVLLVTLVLAGAGMTMSIVAIASAEAARIYLSTGEQR